MPPQTALWTGTIPRCELLPLEDKLRSVSTTAAVIES
jgi:hypothetical protein